MKIDVYTLVRNEEKIMPYFLRHYSPLAHRIFVYDDCSEDSTVEICRREPKVRVMRCKVSGLDIRYATEVQSFDYRKLSRGEADWVISVDADEFVYHPELIETISLMDRLNLEVIECEGWNMIADSFPTGEGQIYEQVRTGVLDHWFDKPCVFKATSDIQFAHGRHSILNGAQLGVAFSSRIKLLHFRYLGEKYFLERNAKHLGRLSQDDIQNARGTHVLPSHTGDHSLGWFKERMRYMQKAV